MDKSHMTTTTEISTAPPEQSPPPSHQTSLKKPLTSSTKGKSDKKPTVQIKPSAEQISRAKAKREAVLKQIRSEKRTMLCSSVFAAICALIWVVAVGTDHWYLVDGGDLDDNNNTSQIVLTDDIVVNGKIFVKSSTGLWRSCRAVRKNILYNFSSGNNDTDNGDDDDDDDDDEIEEWCKYHTLFPNREEIKRNPSLDEHVIDYRRTAICFAIISLLMMVMSLIAAFYTFKNGRYMYKRLASGLYFLTTLCVLVVLEVVVTSVRYEQLNVPFNHPVNSETSYGFSFFLGWFVFFVYLINGCLFLVYSRKRKGEQHQIMGRS